MITPQQAYLLAVGSREIAAQLAFSVKPQVHLAAASFTPGPSVDPTTLTEATFTGYTAIVVTAFGPVHIDQFGQALANISAPSITFTQTAITIINTIYGYWVTEGAASGTGPIVSCDLFPAPIIFGSIGTTLTFETGIAIAPWKYTTIILP